ncbi:DNA polymerase [Peptoniphilus lacydonensis]|uniref:DNA polymerase n=1 Tax=Peptoniphilus lacydonensis TaxID=1673725 RepID=UPI00290D98CC|nr:DNA polymerase [Peptoniphilus lacydonensis]MBS6611382.1 DNA polymerase [Peptoniphilus harei]MDU5378302.1 DNA polymerase [Peptoniphilus lacydonensis]MDU5436690.1 DNA polymerase [Peptoniphilus lacydonensis]
MKRLSIDLETYSSVDLGKSGVYKYAESEDFEILLFAYSIDDEEVKVIDLANGDIIPEEILSAISDKSIEKWAFNANFERVCLSRFLGKRLKPQGWYCTMIWSAYLGLPLSLEKVGEVLKLDKQKMNEGKALIRYFSIPCKPTKTNGMRTRNLPHHDLEKWSTFKEYNQRDVETEMEIKKKLSAFPMPQSEWENYWIDQYINDRGILIDEVLVDSAIKFDQILRDENMDRAIELTGLENPNSPMQLKEWLNKKGLEIDSLAKKDVESALKNAEGDIKEVLELRQELSKSSVRKYDAMKNVKGKDNRARGLIQFYGANRTGRYSGRLIQVQNLRRNNLKDLELARSLVKNRDYETMEMLYDSPSDVLSQLIRTAFIPKEGTRFIISDFSAIEARVLAWLAGEQWVLDAFENGEDIYCRTASRMFGVQVEKHGINGHLRQKGKIATLACGYQGALGALKAMGGIEMGLSEDELQSIVDSWREANPNIVRLWWDIDSVVKRVVKTRTKEEYKSLVISYEKGILFIELPSKRRLAYPKAKIGMNRFGGESIVYEGIVVGNKWDKIESYGGKFVENIVQAIARDILAEAMMRLEKKGFNIVMHIHDEVVIESDSSSIEEINEIMSIVPSWAPGLILDADGFESEFYKKD